jgi:hypothetical protein
VKTCHSRTTWWLEILRNNQKEVTWIEKAIADMKYLEFNNQYEFASLSSWQTHPKGKYLLGHFCFFCNV